jgi:CheY-like chemotaxis protein
MGERSREQLLQGAEVAIGGADVGGCAFACALLAAAQSRGLRLSVKLFDVPLSGAALPPVVVGPLARHRLAALGVALSPESCAVQVEGVLAWAGGQSELMPVHGGTAWIIDAWPQQLAGAQLLQRQLAQSAALRGARFIDRPIDHAQPSGGMIAFRAGGSPERAQLLALTKPLATRGLRPPAMPTRDAVRARLFATPEARVRLGGLIRIFVAPTPRVELLVALPAASSVHLTAYGRGIGATDLALAIAELRRAGALPEGLEIAELARTQVGFGVAPLPRHGRVLALDQAAAASPLDPLSPALEQAQRAALAVGESIKDLGGLRSRAQGLLAGVRGDVGHAVRAAQRMQRAGSLAPVALGRAASSCEAAGGLFFGLGPLPAESSERLWSRAWLGPLCRLVGDEGPGRPAPTPPHRPILVVDDDPVNRTLVCEFLASRHHAVRAVADEMGLLAAAAAEPPGAVVLDVVLNWVDGVRLCRAIKSHPTTRNVPVIMMSGLARASDRRAALSAGASAFFAKPLDLEQLAQQLEDVTTR